MSLRFAVIPGLGAAALVSFALMNATTVAAHENASKPAFYITKVKPIFDDNCARCHGGINHRGGLNIDTRAGLLEGVLKSIALDASLDVRQIGKEIFRAYKALLPGRVERFISNVYVHDDISHIYLSASLRH